MFERLVVEIGDARLEREILDAAQNFLRGLRQHRYRDARKTRDERPGQVRDDRQRGRNNAEPEPAGEALVHLGDARRHLLGLSENAQGVLERELALRGQADEPLAALDQRRAEFPFELPDRRRQRGLRHAAGFGRPAEMLFAGQRHEIGQLSEHHARECSAR